MTFVPLPFSSRRDSRSKAGATPYCRSKPAKASLLRLKVSDSETISYAQSHGTLQVFANHAQVTLHIDNLRGTNAQHQAETAFKAFGRALRMAVELDPRTSGVPSTKGTL